MAKTVDVQIGQVKADRGQVVLKSSAIGSCIAVVAYDAAKKAGAMAHIMLPGEAPAGKKGAGKTKYAVDAIDAIVSKMAQLGSTGADIKVAVVGGANVLKRADDTICENNIESIMNLLKKKRLEIAAEAIGGTDRRNVWLDIDEGIIYYTEGDGGKKQLWRGQ
jgi:chemotaxis protein CheD